TVGTIPIRDGEVALDVLDDFGGLIGKRVFLVGGRVETLVVALRQEIQDAQDRDDDQSVNGRLGEVRGALGFLSRHYALHRIDSIDRAVMNKPNTIMLR